MANPDPDPDPNRNPSPHPNPTKARMETALRDAAAAQQGGGKPGTPGAARQASGGLPPSPSKPAIALKMDFSGFGK